MKLLHLMNYAPLGTRAFDHFILEYEKQATARGWNVTFGFTADPPATMAKQLNWFRYDTADFLQAVAKHKPDVVQTSFHSVFEKPILDLKRRGATKKLIVIDHSSGEGPTPRSWLRLARKWRGRSVGRIVDAVVCVSQYNATRDIERVYLPREKVHVVPNGIDLARFPFKERHDSKVPKLVYVGQLIREKGVHTLLEAMKGLDASLQVAGSGPERNELESFAQTHSLNVQFLGHVADVSALYSEADIAVVPSEWAEAFGLVAIEAMACGAVVLASDAGALPEVVAGTGVIFQKGNAADFKAKLLTLLQDSIERKRLTKPARQRVVESYQLHDCVRRHLDIIEEIQKTV